MVIFERIQHLKSNEIFVSGFLLLILMNMANFFNYLYQFFMARMLGPSDYGILAVLISLSYIFMFPSNSIQTLVSKEVTKSHILGKYGRIRGFLKNLNLKLFIASLVLFGVYSILAIPASGYLKISYSLLLLTGFFIFTSLFNPAFYGILQGTKKFGIIGFNFVLSSILRLVLALLLVSMGFRIFGAIIGFIISAIIGIALVLPFIINILSAKEEPSKTRIFSGDSLAILAGLLLITLMYSLDVILAKLFFPPEIAGNYAVLSTIGKIVLFGILTIGTVMFPISYEKFFKGKKNNTRGILRKTIILISAILLATAMLTLLFPKFIVGLLFGNLYIGYSGLLFYVCIAFGLIASTNILVLYRISVEEFSIGHCLWLLILLIFEVLTLSIYNKTIENFVWAFIVSTLVNLILSVILIRRWNFSNFQSFTLRSRIS